MDLATLCLSEPGSLGLANVRFGILTNPGGTLTLAEWKDVWEIASSVVQVIAIGGGAAASYYFFWYRRQIYPRAVIHLSAHQYRSARNTILIRMTARVRNVGEVLIQLEKGYANLCQIAPCDRLFNDGLVARQSATETTLHEIVAPLITKLRFQPTSGCEIEPNETETINFDFVVERNKYRLLKVHVHFTNVKKKARTIGWDQQMIVRVKSCEAPKPSTGENHGRA